MLRPDGLQAPVMLVAVGRDLRTDADGRAAEVDSARVEGVITSPERVVESLSVTPAVARLDSLVGHSTRSGFRRRIEGLLPGQRSTVAYQLLDDVPTAMLVGGVAVHAAGVSRRPAGYTGPPPDLCAGYVSGGTLQRQVTELGRLQDQPRVGAPSLGRADDADAWHAYDALPPHSVRRVRRIDVWRDGPAGAGVEAFFRDSHTDGDGVETVVHEYTVRAAVDLRSGTFTACEADYGALPWPECPAALGSAGRLVGTPADGLRTRVRDDFVGPSTCTHLNDVFRSLEPVPALLDLIAADHARTP